MRLTSLHGSLCAKNRIRSMGLGVNGGIHTENPYASRRIPRFKTLAKAVYQNNHKIINLEDFFSKLQNGQPVMNGPELWKLNLGDKEDCSMCINGIVEDGKVQRRTVELTNKDGSFYVIEFNPGNKTVSLSKCHGNKVDTLSSSKLKKLNRTERSLINKLFPTSTRKSVLPNVPFVKAILN